MENADLVSQIIVCTFYIILLIFGIILMCKAWKFIDRFNKWLDKQELDEAIRKSHTTESEDKENG